MPFAETWMNLEVIILSEVRYHLYKESNKKDKNEVIYKTEIDSDILKSNLLLSKGNVGGK